MDGQNETTPMDALYTAHYNYDDGAGSIHSRSTAGSKRHADEFTQNYDEDAAAAPRVSMDNDQQAEFDELTLEHLANVSTDRQMMYKDHTTRLQSILESIKNSTKTVLNEMNVYLGDMEDVEKTYIKCRANAQKEGRRLESVAPDVAGATQNFLNQAAASQLFASGVDFAAMMNGVGGGGSE